jgi:hypothetical protein
MPVRNANTASRKNSRGSRSRNRSSAPESHFETAKEAVMNPIAFASVTSVSGAVAPPPAAKPRANAITRSSATRIASTRSVSSSASRRKSISPLTVTALEET